MLEVEKVRVARKARLFHHRSPLYLFGLCFYEALFLMHRSDISSIQFHFELYGVYAVIISNVFHLFFIIINVIIVVLAIIILLIIIIVTIVLVYAVCGI